MSKLNKGEPSLDKIDDYNGNESKQKRNTAARAKRNNKCNLTPPSLHNNALLEPPANKARFPTDAAARR